MFLWKLLRPIQIVGLLIGLAFLAVILTPSREAVEVPVASGSWVYLSDLRWMSASAGRVVLVREGIPSRDTSFTGGALRLAGQSYQRGVGTAVGSEIVYHLGGKYRRFTAWVGLDDATPSADSEGRFLVFLDDVRVFNSGLMRRDDPPQGIELPVTGINELRLVTLGTDGLADWADARLLPAGEASDDPPSSLLDDVVSAGIERAAARARNAEELDALLVAERNRLDDLVSRQPAAERAAPVAVLVEPDRLTLMNAALSVSLGFGGPDNGYLTAFDLAQRRVLIHKTTSSVTLASGRRYVLHEDFLPAHGESYLLREVHEPVFGEGKQVVAKFISRDGRLSALVDLALFADQPSFLYRLALEDVDEDERAAFTFFDPAAGSSLNVGKQASYLTDYNRLRVSAIPDDGLIREERVGLGKPVLLWSRDDGRGLILAAIEETPTTPYFTVELPQGQVVARVGFGSAAASASQSHESPRLYVESTATPHLQDALARYRALMGELYPSRPLPSWVRQQWLSWYVYYMDLNEQVLKEQVDAIAQQLNDLGPWHILIDAGWYVADGRPDADWRKVDTVKFPGGLRSIVDYAHARGIKVVLYLGTPYINTYEETGNWMGLTGLIRAHPDWLIPLGSDELAEHYLLDYRNPQVRRYFVNVLRDFFGRYDVDGIKVDGLASAEGDLPGGPAGPRWVLDETTNQTMNIYRFTFQEAQTLRPDLYLESGWSTPVFAHPYAHTFRFGDEYPNLTNPYPMGGLFEHIDYAAYQLALGQPANMGALYGDPPDAKALHWWLGAALALGNQVSLSLPFAQMSDEALARYRALLTHYRPFAGTTRTDGRISPRWFATTVGPLTYLGVVNRWPEPQEFTVPLASLGMDGETPYIAYDTEDEAFLPVQRELTTQLPGGSFRLFVLRATPGLLWTTSGFLESSGASELALTLTGPSTMAGFAQVLIRDLRSVTLNANSLTLSEDAWPRPGSYTFAPDTKILTIAYPAGDTHRIVIRY